MPNFYQKVNDRLLELLKQGTTPWLMPWKIVPAQNPVTGTIYSGKNMLILNAASYSSSYWLTYNETREIAKSRGTIEIRMNEYDEEEEYFKLADIHVKKGEHSWPVVFYKMIEKEHEGGDSTFHPILRGYDVFNLDQIENGHTLFPDPAVQLPEFTPIQEAENILEKFKQNVNVPIEYVGQRACYIPSRHVINLPNKTHFESEEEFYCTLFHEAIHSVQHLIEKEVNTNFGSKEYAFNELIAQIGSSYLAKECHLDPSTMKNSASYIKGWIPKENWYDIMKGDNSIFIRASGKASKFVNYILFGKENNEITEWNLSDNM